MRTVLILATLFITNFAYGQCKGFQKSKDEFKGSVELTTLWIANSTKLRGNKLQYRIFLKEDTTLLSLKILTTAEIHLSENGELIFLNENQRTIKLKSAGDYKTTEVNTSVGKAKELVANFYMPDSLLNEWDSSFTKCRMYYTDDSMSFDFNHKKNLRMFHEALTCYREEYYNLEE